MRKRKGIFAQAAPEAAANRAFFSWVDEGEVPTLVIDGVIDTGMGWYEDTTTPRQFREALEGYEGRDILVSINSPGGDVFAGFEIYNLLAHRTGKTTVRVIGQAASAASYIAMGASPGCLEMCEASMMMIHSPLSGVYGNAEELRKTAEVLDEIEDIMAAVYMHRFSGTADELHDMLHAERYLSPTEAKALGLCDAIVTPFELAQDPDAMSAQRYAAVSREQLDMLRAAIGTAPRSEKQPQKAPEKVPDYLAQADAAIARMM